MSMSTENSAGGATMPASPTRPDDWDPAGPDASADPMAVQARLRDECPVAWTNRIGDGFWALTRWDDIAQAARDTATFSSAGNPRFGERPSPPIEVDRPEHTIWRRLIAPYFTRDSIAVLEPIARRNVVELLQPLIGAGRVDVAEHFTYPLPALVLCALLRLPTEDAATIKAWSEQLFRAMEERDNDPVRLAAAESALQAYGHNLIARRGAMGLDPDEDLVSGLITKEVGGRRLTTEEVVGMIRLLLSAGHNSTTSSLGISILRVAGDAELQQRLRSDPDAVPRAIDEFLRHESPVMATKRVAARDVEIHGRSIRAGEEVFLVWGSANRDERHYDRPEECQIDRESSDHVAFGRGIHRCVGMGLALMEIRVALEELLERTSWIGLDGDAVRTNWERFGVSSLPLRLSPTGGRHDDAQPAR
jgi:cytochrome P450